MTANLVESEEYASAPLPLLANTRNGIARKEALALLRDGQHAPTSVVSYQSGGYVLIHVDSEPDPGVVERILNAGLTCVLLVSGEHYKDVALKEGPLKTDQIEGQVGSFTGYLGNFNVTLVRPGGHIEAAKLVGRAGRGFDVVLDLASEPLSRASIPPIGYFSRTPDEELDGVVDQLSAMTGEFDKPKFYSLDPSICAHKSRGLVGCTRCLDVCPTEAISSSEESVDVDPYLCQGVGVCTTVCPTGAITYAFPQVSDLLDDLRRALHRYHDEGGETPVVLFHDEEKGKRLLGSVIDSIGENVIPVEVENVASIGMDIWLTCLVYGARHCLLLATDDLPENVVDSILREIQVTREILGGMGYPQDRVALLQAGSSGEIPNLIPAEPDGQLVTPAGFAGFNEKRTTLRLALEHFYEHAPKPRKTIPLASGSPFGRVKVDKKACTLCMSCAAVCPVSALTDGGGMPKLLFLEKNCVQCGVCERACPEDAITLEARFNFEAGERDNPRVMYEEEPFNCVKCGKPFSTQSMMTRVREKLKAHWMYQDEAQIRRLEMCDNCRIEDLYVHSGGMDPYDKPAKPTGSKA